MGYSSDQASCAAEGTHLVLYDGMCGFCNGLVQFLLEHDKRGVFAFASLHSQVGKHAIEQFGGDPHELTSFCVEANYRSNRAQIFRRSEAALLIATEIGWPWKAARVMRALPVWILDGIYAVIARNRYRLSGRSCQCLSPAPEFRHRFIDGTATPR